MMRRRSLSNEFALLLMLVAAGLFLGVVIEAAVHHPPRPAASEVQR